MAESIAEKMLESGVSPLELVRYDVLSCSDGDVRGSFTEVRINSLELGALYPAQYRVVTNRNNQSVRLATWAFRRIVEQLTETPERQGWTSFYIPAKLLMRDQLKTLLENERKKSNCDFSRLVAEVSSEILYEDAEQVTAKMQELRQEYGIRFLLSEFGDEYCPVLRLPLYPVDFVLLDSSVNNTEALAGPAASAVRMAKQCGKTVIARIDKPIRTLPRDSTPDCYVPELSGSERRDT